MVEYEKCPEGAPAFGCNFTYNTHLGRNFIPTRFTHMATVTVAPPLTVDRSETGENSHTRARECALPRVSNPSPHVPHPHPRLRVLLVALSCSKCLSGGLGDVERPVHMRDAIGVVCAVGMGGGMHMESGPSRVGGLAQKKGSPIHHCTCPLALASSTSRRTAASC